jgi:hypothetical protein
MHGADGVQAADSAALGRLCLDQLAHAPDHLSTGGLADHQALGLHAHEGGDQRQDHADGDRGDGVGSDPAQQVGCDGAGKRDEKASEGGKVLYYFSRGSN